MPTTDELRKSSDKLFKKFGIPTAAVGVDGVHIRLGKKPFATDPAMPDDVTPKVFMNRKNYYSLNVQGPNLNKNLIRKHINFKR